MLVQILPDTMTKFAQMGDATIYEPAGDQPQAERRRVPYQSRSLAECITNVSTPTGKLPILKTMLTTSPLRFSRKCCCIVFSHAPYCILQPPLFLSCFLDPLYCTSRNDSGVYPLTNKQSVHSSNKKPLAETYTGWVRSHTSQTLIRH